MSRSLAPTGIDFTKGRMVVGGLDCTQPYSRTTGLQRTRKLQHQVRASQQVRGFRAGEQHILEHVSHEDPLGERGDGHRAIRAVHTPKIGFSVDCGSVVPQQVGSHRASHFAATSPIQP